MDERITDSQTFKARWRSQIRYADRLPLSRPSSARSLSRFANGLLTIVAQLLTLSVSLLRSLVSFTL